MSLDPLWLDSRPDGFKGEVLTSLPGSEPKGPEAASTGQPAASVVHDYEGDVRGVTEARHSTLEEVKARVSQAAAPLSPAGKRAMDLERVAKLMSARDQKKRVLEPLKEVLEGAGAPAAPSVPESPDRSGQSVAPQGMDSPDFRVSLDAFHAIRARVSHSLVMEKKAAPEDVRLLINKATNTIQAADLKIQRLERELNDQRAKLIAVWNENRELNETLAGYRKATAVPPPDKSAPPESPVPHDRSASDAEQLGCSVDPFDSRSAPDVERLPKRLPDSARVLDKSPEKQQEEVTAQLPAGGQEVWEFGWNSQTQRTYRKSNTSELPNSSAEPGERSFEYPGSYPWISDKIKLAIDTGSPVPNADIVAAIQAADRKIAEQRKGLEDHKHKIEILERELVGHRATATRAGFATEPGCGGDFTVNFRVPLPPDDPCTVAPPSLLTSVDEVRDFRKEICLAVLSKSHATIPEGLAEYSRKLAEAVLIADSGPSNPVPIEPTAHGPGPDDYQPIKPPRAGVRPKEERP